MSTQEMLEYDLVIVGTGSGNSIPGPEFDGWRIAIVEKGVFGGTCLNVGCIPSKMFVYAADVAETIRGSATYGIQSEIGLIDWPAIRDRVFARIDPIAEGGEEYRLGDECPNITVFKGNGRLTGAKTLEVTGQDGQTWHLSGRHVVLGAGARPFIPPYNGLADVPFHTSDTIMRIDSLPQRLIVLGGGYIAAELGHVFSAFGSDVTLVNRGERLLRREDDEVSERFTELMSRRINVLCDSEVTNVGYDGEQFWVEIRQGDSFDAIYADQLLVAAGRVPNSDQIGAFDAGIACTEGRVEVDEYFRTSVDGVWAFGDISNSHQLKHLANAEVKALRLNLLVEEGQIEGPMRSVDDRFVPHAVFGYPQVASVGLTESEGRAQGHELLVSTQEYAGTAYGWAMEESESFCKLIADAQTRKLLGAHIIGPQASTLIQQLIQGMEFGQTVDQMAEQQFYIHPALTEVIENALLGF